MLSSTFKTVRLSKRYPLAISRGSSAGSENLFVTISHGEYQGLGELSPAPEKGWTAASGKAQIESLELDPSPVVTYGRMRDAKIDPPAMAAVDIALWDLLAKRAGLPLYRMLGLTKACVATSVTIGLNSPEVTRKRVPEILQRTGAHFLKIKLGSPEGREYDRHHFVAAAEAAAPFGVGLRVDANGGWTVPETLEMMDWLADRGVEYVEQPLAEGQESELAAVFERRRLPIIVDESVQFARDVLRVRQSTDGVNLKLMKCGGITGALAIVAVARASGLRTMIGCMSESSVAIAAGASIGSLFDFIDLDSHLNLDPDPATGAAIDAGVVRASEASGHGATLLA